MKNVGNKQTKISRKMSKKKKKIMKNTRTTETVEI